MDIMKSSAFKLFLFIVVISGNFAIAQSTFKYLSPLPDSKYNMPQATIIIKPEAMPTESSLNGSSIIVKGEKSGIHTGKILFSQKDNCIIFKPDVVFSTGEKVSVEININNSEKFGYSFFVSKNPHAIRYSNIDDEMKEGRSEYRNTESVSSYHRPDSLPSDMPPITIKTNLGGTDAGKIFLANLSNVGAGYAPYMMILNNDGSLYWYKKMPVNAYDFKKQPNGLLTYSLYNVFKYYAMDTAYNVVDSFYCGNGYNTDEHELLLMDNGHALMMGYDPQIIDMSEIVPGGDTAATVIGMVIQELNENKEVIFQWSTFDHFSILDATHTNFTSSIIDCVHSNALSVESDGNIMMSSRNMDEITKINRTTGDIIWRLGGSNNQFTFINDTNRFSHQHSIRRVSPTNIILFDNGNFHTPQFSRAVEYTLDEVNKTCTLVWEFRNTPTVQAYAMGNVQRLPNGNTVIGWGTSVPTMTEVDPSGQKIYEISFPITVMNYRAFRFVWKDSVTTSVSTIGETAGSYYLRQNYPNPFNPVTNIEFEIPKNAFVSLKIYDALGRNIENLLSKEMVAGKYSVQFNAANLSTGLYFYEMTSGNFRQVRKMVLIK